MSEMEHPLQSSWTIYIHTQSVSLTYSNSYTRIGSFSTIEEFWRFWNHLPPVNFIYDNHLYFRNRRVVAYSIFRDNILPEWEKTNNINGSEWGCRENITSDDVRQLWLSIALGCIGEQVPNCVGFRYVNKCNRTRQLHKIELWMNTCSNQLVTMTLNSMRNVLKIDSNLKFTLMRHNDKKFQAAEYHRRKNM